MGREGLERGRWVRWSLALLLAGLVLGLPVAWMPGSERLRVALLWLGLWGAPALAWEPWIGPPSPVPLRRAGVAAMGGGLHLLLAAFLSERLGLGLGGGLWVWGILLIPPLLLGLRPRRVWIPVGGERARGMAVALLLLLSLVALDRGLRPTPWAPESDALGHLGGVQDARATDRWMPPDRSFDPRSEAVDPRFGLGHGLHAAVVRRAEVGAPVALEAAAIALSPLWFLAHAWLFLELGLGPGLAMVGGLLFLYAGAGGRGFGLGAVGYPGNLALLLTVLGTAGGLRALLDGEARARWRHGVIGALLVALSVRVHPFGWWATGVALGHGALLLLLRARTRRLGWRLLVGLAAIGAVGVALLRPLLEQRAVAAGGLHAMVTDAMFVGGGRFVVDPLVLARWCGTGALWALPLLLLAPRRWFADPRRCLVAGAAVAVWTVSLDPLVEPWMWSQVGYLSVRLGRLVHTPLLWLLVLGVGGSAWLRARSLGRRFQLGLWVGLAGLLLLGELRVAVGGFLQNAGVDGARAHLESVVRAVRSLDGGVLVADPRTSYAVRGLRGGTLALLPVAHASPLDHGLPERLALYRRLLDPGSTAEGWRAAWRELGGGPLLVHPALEAAYGGPEFGFVPDGDAQRALLERLRAAGAVPAMEGEGWALFASDALEELRWVVPPVEAPPPPQEGELLDPPLRASRFELVAMRPGRSRVHPGEELALRLWYRAIDGDPVTVHPEWEAVHARLEGPMATVPDWLQPVGKPFRKLFLDRHGRSRARFGATWIPLDGVPGPDGWGGRLVVEERRLHIPGHVTPGAYGLQLTVQESTWRARRDLRDYLRDEDRWSGPERAEIEIVGEGP